MPEEVTPALQVFCEDTIRKNLKSFSLFFFVEIKYISFCLVQNIKISSSFEDKPSLEFFFLQIFEFD